MQKPHSTSEQEANESRRKFLKKGALASSAVAVGLFGANTATAQQEGVLTYFDDYEPGQTFRVLAQLPQDITVTLLQLPNGNTVPEISQPDDYNGYVIRPTAGGNNRSQGATYIFTRRSLNTDTSYQFGTTANVFSSQLSLISTSLGGQSGNGGTTTTSAGSDGGGTTTTTTTATTGGGGNQSS